MRKSTPLGVEGPLLGCTVRRAAGLLCVWVAYTAAPCVSSCEWYSPLPLLAWGKGICHRPVTSVHPELGSSCVLQVVVGGMWEMRAGQGGG